VNCDIGACSATCTGSSQPDLAGCSSACSCTEC
jgi:hypothetical protein